jgi:predicted ATPase
MADKTGAASTPRAAARTAAESQQLKLHTRLGQAMMHSRGYGSEESKTAFARARTLAAGVGDASERFDAYYGLFIGSYARGELSLARETAESFLQDAETEGRMSEAAGARRNAGMACLFQGDLVGAEANLAEALRTYDPTRDRDARFRFGLDTGAGAAMYLALASWAMGRVERARALGDQALARADETAHPPTRASVYYHFSLYQVFRGDPEAVKRKATIAVELGREHGMAFWLALGEVLSNWARAWLEDRESGMTGLREALAAYLGQGNKMYVPLIKGRLAELEAEGNDADGALRGIDEALALANETGERWTDALLHRIRGAILLKRDPANPAPAEESFLTASAIAQAQKARSFELQAALALAKLYQLTERPIDARAVLAPVLEGISPTPEMPEIAEAQALLAVLAETGEVKAVIAQRQRRLDLQTSYAQATMWAKGFAAEETEAAFVRLREFAGSAESAEARFLAYDAQCVRNFMRGELRLARETAETFLREAEANGLAKEAGAARRALGLALLFQGELKAARSVLERALNDYVPERDGETQFRFNRDPEVGAAANLALAEWHLGGVERAHQLMNRAVRRAEELGNAAAVAYALNWKVVLESHRHDVSATRDAADAVLALTEERGIKTYADLARMHANWARGRQLDPEAGAAGLRQALAGYKAHGYKNRAPFLHGLLAELEAMTRGPDSALTLVDQGLALSQETGEHYTDAYLHRLRGEFLLIRDPANPAPAEEAFQTALAIAKEQGARSYELLASLALAKLCQSTNRPGEAHAVLAPAVEGFAPTPEMPEIAEAQALLDRLAQGGEGAVASKGQAT